MRTLPQSWREVLAKTSVTKKPEIHPSKKIIEYWLKNTFECTIRPVAHQCVNSVSKINYLNRSINCGLNVDGKLSRI